MIPTSRYVLCPFLHSSPQSSIPTHSCSHTQDAVGVVHGHIVEELRAVEQEDYRIEEVLVGEEGCPNVNEDAEGGGADGKMYLKRPLDARDLSTCLSGWL